MILALLLLTAQPSAAQPQAPDTALWQQVLDRHVNDKGEVRYGALKQDPAALQRFVQQMEQVSPDSHPALFPTRASRLAYWINAYNALVLHTTVRDYPQKRTRLTSDLGRANYFYRMKVSVGGRNRTLSEIENRELRDGFREPRIHFAIVCASRGCPWLGRTAYRADNVESWLEVAAKSFLSQPRNCQIDVSRRVIRLSSIFKWFAADFGKSDSERLAFIARYRPQEAAALRQGSWTMEYSDWDWTLNDASPR